MSPLPRFVALVFASMLAFAPALARPVLLAFDPQDEPAGFAVRELESALARRTLLPSGWI